MYWTNKSIKNTVSITTGTNETLTFVLEDNTTKTITIPQGKYFTNYIQHKSDLVDEINRQLEANSITGITAKLGGSFGNTGYDGNYEPQNIVKKWSNYGRTDWIAIDGKLKQTINQDLIRIIYNPYDFNQKNYRISAKFSAEADDDVFGYVFRCKDRWNYYYVGYESGEVGSGLQWNEEKIRIYKVVDGVETMIASAVVNGWSRNIEYKFEVEVNNDVINIYLDDEKVLTTIDSTHKTGTYGFMALSQVFSVYDIKVVKDEYLEVIKDSRESFVVFDSTKSIKYLDGTLTHVLML